MEASPGFRNHRSRTAVLGLVLVVAVLAAATATVTRQAAARQMPVGRPVTVTALGDSVPSGTNCVCTPYPEQTATALAAVLNRRVVTHNDAVPGSTSTDVASELVADDPVVSDVRAADVVIVHIGANDVEFDADCGTTLTCYQPTLPAVARNLTAIVDRIHALTPAKHVVVVLLGYWNVWLGGKYARANGTPYVTTADTLTFALNDEIAAVAAQEAATYVDLRTAFRGRDDTSDETPLLAPDGDHPNAAGHARIAEATESALEGEVASGALPGLEPGT